MKNGRMIRVFLLLLALVVGWISPGGEVAQAKSTAYEASLLQDLAERENLPQTDVPKHLWYSEKEMEGWGPMSREYPGVERLLDSLPPGTDKVQWKRDRIIAVAKHYIGLPYRHHHIPGWSPERGSKLNPKAGPGLDCSNFTAWVYNFAFGISLHGDVELQAQMKARPGYTLPHGVRQIEKGQGFLPGDLLYIMDESKKRIVHVVLYIDEEHIIDSTGTHVDVRHFSGWYRERLSHGVRIF